MTILSVFDVSFARMSVSVRGIVFVDEIEID